MPRFVFVCEEHEEFGEKGWRLKNQPDFDPLGGMSVAHDVMEHFPSGDGGPADEFLALGAAYWLRGLTRNFNNPRFSAASHIASDFPEIFRHVLFEGMSIDTPPARALRPLDNEEVEQSFCAAIAEAKELLESEIDEEALEEAGTEAIAQMLTHAQGWLREGFRRVQKRYHGLCPYTLVEVFRDIEREADRLLQQAEEGYEMIVDFKVRDCYADVRLKEVYTY